MINGQERPGQTEIDADVTLDLRSLRASVEFDEGVPSLVLSDGISTVRVSTRLGGPVVRDLIPVGRLVASVRRFQTVCNRFTRSRGRSATPAAKPPGASRTPDKT